MPITALPTPPSRSDTPANFVIKADAFIAALPQFVTEANAQAALLTLASTTDTSATSNTIGTGAKTFAVSAGKSFQPGMYLVIADTAAPSTNSMYGQITSYGGTSLVMNILATFGSGTKTAWTISQSAAGGAGLGANTFAGHQTLTSGDSLNESISTLASSATPDIWSDQSNVIDYTGTATATGFAAAPQAGVRRTLICNAASIFTAGANMLIDGIASGSNFTAGAGDSIEVIAITTTQFRLKVIKANGSSIVDGSKIQPITASVSSNALTIRLNPTILDFRSSTLGNGAISTRAISSALSLVISSGSTLGTTNAVSSRIAVLAIDNAGTVELAAVNLTGGVNLNETGVISTTAEGGAGGADSASVIYSTTARTNVPYRVVGFVESTQAVAGTWATAPSLIQGCGGQALAAMSSLGYGQTWQVVTRTTGTTYYNTTGKPIALTIQNGTGNVSTAVTINGVTQAIYGVGGCSGVIPVGASYSIVLSGGSVANANELR